MIKRDPWRVPTYNEICSLKQLIYEQRLALNECKSLLSDVENTAADFTCQNRCEGLLVYSSLSTQVLKKRTCLGKAAAVNLIEADTGNGDHGVRFGWAISGGGRSCLFVIWRKQEFWRLLKESFSSEVLSIEDMERLMEQYHDVFSLEDWERGETSLAEFCIDTGESVPIKQAATILRKTRDCHTVKKYGRGWSNTAVAKSLGQPRGIGEETW